MPRYVCCLDGKLFEFSTTIEAPVTSAMDEAEFRSYYQEVYGEIKANQPGAEGLDAKIDRARAFGTSSLMRKPGDNFEKWLEDHTRKTYAGNFPGLSVWKREYLTWSDDAVTHLRERHNPVDG